MNANPLASPGPDRIMAAGDWHGNAHRACAVIGYAGLRGIPVVLHLGDFGYWTPGPWTERYLDALEEACVSHHVELIVVDGNHECFTALYELAIDPDTGMRPLRPHIHHLPRGLRWTWHGSTWMALGGAHSVDRLDRKEGTSWWPEEHLTDAEIEHAISGGPVDVIAAHDAPDRVDIPGLHPTRFPAQEIATSEWHRERVGRVVDATGPAVLLHGHYHVRYTAFRDNTAIIGLADDSALLRDNVLVIDTNDIGDHPDPE